MTMKGKGSVTRKETPEASLGRYMSPIHAEQVGWGIFEGTSIVDFITTRDGADYLCEYMYHDSNVHVEPVYRRV